MFIDLSNGNWFEIDTDGAVGLWGIQEGYNGEVKNAG